MVAQHLNVLCYVVCFDWAQPHLGKCLRCCGGALHREGQRFLVKSDGWARYQLHTHTHTQAGYSCSLHFSDLSIDMTDLFYFISQNKINHWSWWGHNFVLWSLLLVDPLAKPHRLYLLSTSTSWQRGQCDPGYLGCLIPSLISRLQKMERRSERDNQTQGEGEESGYG